MPEQPQVVKGFFIPEEPIVNEFGLIIPPADVPCPRETCKFYEANECVKDRHHLWWESKAYNRAPYKGMRELGCFIIEVCRSYHDLTHAAQAQPMKPEPEIARVAIKQYELEEQIRVRYEGVFERIARLEAGEVVREKQVQNNIERLLYEIDQRKEDKQSIVGDVSVLPNQVWFAAAGQVFLKATTDLEPEAEPQILALDMTPLFIPEQK